MDAVGAAKAAVQRNVCNLARAVENRVIIVLARAGLPVCPLALPTTQNTDVMMLAELTWPDAFEFARSSNV